MTDDKSPRKRGILAERNSIRERKSKAKENEFGATSRFVGTVLLVGILAGLLLTLFVGNSDLSSTAARSLSAVVAVSAALMGSLGHLAPADILGGPSFAAVLVLLAVLFLRLLVERIGLFLTVPWQDEPTLMALEFAASCLLFLPLAGFWVATFYAALPPGGVIVFGIAYLATLVVAHSLSLRVPNVWSFASLRFGQAIAVLASLGTIITITVQGFSGAPSPLADPLVAAIVVLLAVVTLRFGAELAHLFVTVKITLGHLILVSVVFSPLVALWLLAFSTVSPLGTTIFLLTYLVTHLKIRASKFRPPGDRIFIPAGE